VIAEYRVHSVRRSQTPHGFGGVANVAVALVNKVAGHDGKVGLLLHGQFDRALDMMAGQMVPAMEVCQMDDSEPVKAGG
jgi:hypothetical protein